MAVNEVAGATFKAESKVAADGALAVVLRGRPHRDRGRHADARRRPLQGVAGRPPPGRERRVRPVCQRRPRSRRDVDRRPPGAAARLRPRRAAARVVAAAAEPLGRGCGDVDAATVARLARDGHAAARARARAADGRRLRPRRLRRGDGRRGWAAPPCASPAAAPRTGSYWTDRDLTAAPALTSAPRRGALGGRLGRRPRPRRARRARTPTRRCCWRGELGAGAPGGVREHAAWLARPAAGSAARPGVVAGLSAAVAGVRALQRQRPGRAIAHGATGLLAQSHHVVCLEGAG